MIMNDGVRVLVKVAGENTSSVTGYVFLSNEIFKNQSCRTSSSEVGKAQSLSRMC